MKKNILLAITAFISFCTITAQTVTQPDRPHSTGSYKKSVKSGFYNELNKQIKIGYHGFVDFGYQIGIGDYTLNKFEFSSTHGYQFNPYLFLGGGIGFNLMQEYETPDMYIPLDQRKFMIDIPLYAETRFTFIDGHISPFISGRAGYYLTHHGGFYANASVGCRFAISSNQAVNILIGYCREELEFETFDGFISSDNMHYRTQGRKLPTEGISIKIGYEF